MLSFRQKVVISHLVCFLLFVALLYPLVGFVIEKMKVESLKGRVEKVVNQVKHEPSVDRLVEKLKEIQSLLFFEITLISPPKEILYASKKGVRNEYAEHTDAFSSKEVIESLGSGDGFEVRFSPIFEQEMVYVAVPLKLNGKQLVLRGAFPYGQEQELIYRVTFSFLLIGLITLFLFSFVSWTIIHYLTAPVRKILQTIRPYQMGIDEEIPLIKLEEYSLGRDEFFQLAETLNSLSARIRFQIANLVEEKDEKSAILESLIEGVIAVDECLVVVYVNKTAINFLGVAEEKLVGKNLKSLNLPNCIEIALQVQELERPASTVITLPNNKDKIFDVIAVPRKREGKGALLVFQDKTELRKVIELGKDFIANASHELKTPITIIRGFAETLHDHPELSRDMHAEITEKIVSNCHRMNTLVKNLLTLAAVDEGLPASRLAMADLQDLVGQARQTVLTVHKNARISIELIGKEPFQALLDSDLFLQALINLIENAAKYSKPPAIIEVIIRNKQKEFVLSVRDQGVGIPKEDLDRIFERFFAVDKSHSRNLGGSGLGLSIVERIVEKHKGRIEVLSEVGKGTEFILYIPKNQRDFASD
jgi:two-component system, OmpR family, phosphate regulon sensor histidine kinase PhoR